MERQFNFIFAALIKKAVLAKRLRCEVFKPRMKRIYTNWRLRRSTARILPPSTQFLQIRSRGRHGTSCPAMTDLRLLWGLAPPPRPHESAGRFTPIVLKRLRGKMGDFAAGLPEGCCASFPTSRTILHAARNGHISISRQRALAVHRYRGASLMSLLSLKSFPASRA